MNRCPDGVASVAACWGTSANCLPMPTCVPTPNQNRSTFRAVDQLTLEIDFGADEDICDRVIWGRRRGSTGRRRANHHERQLSSAPVSQAPQAYGKLIVCGSRLSCWPHWHSVLRA